MHLNLHEKLYMLNSVHNKIIAVCMLVIMYLNALLHRKAFALRVGGRHASHPALLLILSPFILAPGNSQAHVR